MPSTRHPQRTPRSCPIHHWTDTARQVATVVRQTHRYTHTHRYMNAAMHMHTDIHTYQLIHADIQTPTGTEKNGLDKVNLSTLPCSRGAKQSLTERGHFLMSHPRRKRPALASWECVWSCVCVSLPSESGRRVPLFSLSACFLSAETNQLRQMLCLKGRRARGRGVGEDDKKSISVTRPGNGIPFNGESSVKPEAGLEVSVTLDSVAGLTGPLIFSQAWLL